MESTGRQNPSKRGREVLEGLDVLSEAARSSAPQLTDLKSSAPQQHESVKRPRSEQRNDGHAQAARSGGHTAAFAAARAAAVVAAASAAAQKGVAQGQIHNLGGSGASGPGGLPEAARTNRSLAESGPDMAKAPEVPDLDRADSMACPICKKEFTRRSNLHRHYRAVHQQEKEFGCSKCTKRFARIADLNTHIQSVHDRVRKFQCDVCQKWFFQRSHVSAHKRLVHQRKSLRAKPGRRKKLPNGTGAAAAGAIVGPAVTSGTSVSTNSGTMAGGPVVSGASAAAAAAAAAAMAAATGVPRQHASDTAGAAAAAAAAAANQPQRIQPHGRSPAQLPYQHQHSMQPGQSQDQNQNAAAAAAAAAAAVAAAVRQEESDSGSAAGAGATNGPIRSSLSHIHGAGAASMTAFVPSALQGQSQSHAGQVHGHADSSTGMGMGTGMGMQTHMPAAASALVTTPADTRGVHMPSSAGMGMGMQMQMQMHGRESRRKSGRRPQQPGQFTCMHCGIVFTQQGTMMRHIRTKHSSAVLMLKCGECPRLFSRKENFERHLRRVHKVSADDAKARSEAEHLAVHQRAGVLPVPRGRKPKKEVPSMISRARASASAAAAVHGLSAAHGGDSISMGDAGDGMIRHQSGAHGTMELGGQPSAAPSQLFESEPQDQGRADGYHQHQHQHQHQAGHSLPLSYESSRPSNGNEPQGGHQQLRYSQLPGGATGQSQGASATAAQAAARAAAAAASAPPR